MPCEHRYDVEAFQQEATYLPSAHPWCLRQCEGLQNEAAIRQFFAASDPAWRWVLILGLRDLRQRVAPWEPRRK